MICYGVFFCNDTATTEIYTLSLHDALPIFIADSNHGFKMIGVGKLVAAEIMGETSELLEPFRLSRYAEGKLHPVSASPFPWS